MSSSAQLEIGESVVAIGYDLTEQAPTSIGGPLVALEAEVIAVGRTLQTGEAEPGRLLEIDAVIIGVIVDSAGKALGITVGWSSDTSVVLSMDRAARLLDFAQASSDGLVEMRPYECRSFANCPTDLLEIDRVIYGPRCSGVKPELVEQPYAVGAPGLGYKEAWTIQGASPAVVVALRAPFGSGCSWGVSASGWQAAFAFSQSDPQLALERAWAECEALENPDPDQDCSLGRAVRCDMPDGATEWAGLTTTLLGSPTFRRR
ncbi:MAG: hypothetical protein ACE5MI_07715 [Acidimicrobiia bacterium]